MKTIAILFTLAIIGTTIADKCASNCVLCAGADEASHLCTTCWTGYFSMAGECTATTVANCDIANAAATCTHCMTGFALGEDFSCTANPTDAAGGMVAGASAYSYDTTTMAFTVTECTAPNGNADCTAAPATPVTDCATYDVAGVCTSCASGKTLIGTGTSCDAAEGAIAGCWASSATANCDVRCDAAGGFWALTENACASFAKIASALTQQKRYISSPQRPHLINFS